ncbi:MAG TPA: hypothetical protein VEQ41_08795 [Solirubrobacterales bacterium]|nr:hypothetical protein [Solirubrobacterales bacterium]
MKTVAEVRYESRRWELSLDGQRRTYAEVEEAIEEARRLLRQSGGGTIDVAAGPEVEAQRIGVPGATSQFLMDLPRPPLGPQRSTPAPAPTANAVADISTLRTSYQEARARIEALADPVERDIGLATLRLEARHTLNQLRTTAAGLSEEDLRPLSAYVAALEGGEGAEAAVERIDATVERVLSDVSSSLLTMQLVGAASAIAAGLAWLAGVFQDLGSALAFGILGGAAGPILTGTRFVGSASQEVGTAAWRWAEQLGGEAERAMERPREIERRLWAAFVAAPWRYESLAERARARAKRIILGVWFLVGFAAVAMAIGATVALVDHFETVREFQPDSTPSLEP